MANKGFETQKLQQKPTIGFKKHKSFDNKNQQQG
jgi:hypothetical protein